MTAKKSCASVLLVVILLLIPLEMRKHLAVLVLKFEFTCAGPSTILFYSKNSFQNDLDYYLLKHFLLLCCPTK